MLIDPAELLVDSQLLITRVEGHLCPTCEFATDNTESIFIVRLLQSKHPSNYTSN